MSPAVTHEDSNGHGHGNGESVNTHIITLTRFLTEGQVRHKRATGEEATGDFTLLCHALQFAFKSIAYYIRRATLINLTGLAGSANVTGDAQKKLDVISNDLFIEAMRSCGRCAMLVSEEEENIIVFDHQYGDNNSNNGLDENGGRNGGGIRPRYAIACDPIDGSSNLDAGVSVGTIFGVYRLDDRRPSSSEAYDPRTEMLRPGTELVAAGFTMYGASAQLVITMRGGSVNGFTLDNGLGEFILTHPDMRLPRRRAIYSVNEGNAMYWEEHVRRYFDSLKYPPERKKEEEVEGEGERDGAQETFNPYSARYIGSMVADAYRTLLYGGVFAYPADRKSPKGKLRILYECAPMAMVFENAGGQAVNSNMKRMLEVVPEHIHDRSGIYLGSYDEIEKVKAFHRDAGVGTS